MHHSGVLKILAQHFCNLYLVVFSPAFLLSDDPVPTNICTARPLAPSSLATLANAVFCAVSGNRAWGSATCTVLVVACRRARAGLSGGLLA